MDVLAVAFLWNYVGLGVIVLLLTLLFFAMGGLLPVDYSRTFGKRHRE